jgi:hypothetical protein
VHCVEKKTLQLLRICRTREEATNQGKESLMCIALRRSACYATETRVTIDPQRQSQSWGIKWKDNGASVQ